MEACCWVTQTVSWIEAHDGLAAWVQAIGSIAAILGAFAVSQSAIREQRRQFWRAQRVLLADLEVFVDRMRGHLRHVLFFLKIPIEQRPHQAQQEVRSRINIKLSYESLQSRLVKEFPEHHFSYSLSNLFNSWEYAFGNADRRLNNPDPSTTHIRADGAIYWLLTLDEIADELRALDRDLQHMKRETKLVRRSLL